jgi:hypothetical protein
MLQSCANNKKTYPAAGIEHGSYLLLGFPTVRLRHCAAVLAGGGEGLLFQDRVQVLQGFGDRQGI